MGDIASILFKDNKTTFSTLLWALLGTLLFVFFIMCCISAGDSATYLGLKIWHSQESNPQFPQFVVCPEFEEGVITAITCRILEGRNQPPSSPITPTEVKLPYSDKNPLYICYAYNTLGNAWIGQHTVVCSINATRGTQSAIGNAQVFFTAIENRGDFRECATSECLQSSNSYILPWGSITNVGFEKSVYYMDTHSSKTSQKFKVYGSAYPTTSPQDHNILSFFYYNSNVVAYYEAYNFFNFLQFMGAVGGAAFAGKIVHDLVLALVGHFMKTSMEASPLIPPRQEDQL